MEDLIDKGSISEQMEPLAIQKRKGSSIKPDALFVGRSEVYNLQFY
jgi:hypothetical protein